VSESRQKPGRILVKKNQLPFRCMDDDDEVYYEGLLVDNDQCDAQISVLDYTMYDAGCVQVQVKRGGKWITDIS